jgi:hypothetical protein
MTGAAVSAEEVPSEASAAMAAIRSVRNARHEASPPIPDKAYGASNAASA